MKWLPETDIKPSRPDWPVFRHLTFAEIHAAQLGLTLAIIVYWGQQIGEEGVVFGIVLLAVEAVISQAQKTSNDSTADHTIGFHDVVAEPVYAAMIGLATYGTFVVIWGVP